MIKAVVFDFAEVIAEGPMAKWLRENLPPEDQKLANYQKYSHKWDVGEMSREEVYKILSELTGILPEQIWEKIYEKSEPNTGVINLIKKLKKEYKIILFSNFIGEHLRKLLAKYGITDDFDEIIVSSEHKMRKPDVKFFELLRKKVGIKKNEIIFIDDKKENIDAALKFGIGAIRFIDINHLENELRKRGVKY